MSDLIRREDAIEALKKYQELESDNFSDTDPIIMMTVATIANCIEEIVNLPSAEPERKTGKWLPHPGDEDLDVCSVCGTGCKRRERGISQYISWVTEYNYQFCPNCGARMTR